MLINQEKIGIIDRKLLSYSPSVKEKIAFGNSLDSLAQFEDLRLKYCILMENAKNSTSGSNDSLLVFTHSVEESTSYDK